ncbi:MAG: hypothetical protein J1E63_01005 [Muribaculaceae bacterium]|nr:hypothetical protein [Muribaculaceae bacterium]
MTRKSTIYMLVMMLLSIVASCNSEDINLGDNSYSSVAVKSFTLQKNDSVLVNLDSVFFSIDLVERRIFNADSLPKGTRIDRLQIKVGADMARNVEIIQSRVDKSDTTIHLLDTPNDSIDFSNGPVTLKITSYDGEFTASYQIQVNVHKSEPDTLCWSSMARRDIPTTLSAVTASRMVKQGDNVVLIATNGTEATVATTTDPAVDNWTINSATLPAGANVNTLTATTDALFLIAYNQAYTSTDLGQTWTATGTAMSWIYGVSNGEVVGYNAGSAMTVCYPSGYTVATPAKMPVTATSTMVGFGTKWSDTEFSVLIGGKLADGSLTPAAWGWDGKQWACINTNTNMPGLQGVTLFNYKSFKVSAGWTVTEVETLFALGGADSYGTMDNKVFISTDQGYTWAEAGELMQLPAFMPELNGASVVVCSSTLTVDGGVRSIGPWDSFDVKLPAWYQLVSLPGTRVSKPVTEWECPYIYLAGGMTENNRAMTQMWRGVINRLRFVPQY